MEYTLENYTTGRRTQPMVEGFENREYIFDLQKALKDEVFLDKYINDELMRNKCIALNGANVVIIDSYVGFVGSIVVNPKHCKGVE